MQWRQILSNRVFHAICAGLVLLTLAIVFDFVGAALLAVLLIAFAALSINWLVSAARRGSSDSSSDD